MRNGEKGGRVIFENSTTTALASSAIYTGKWYTTEGSSAITVALKTDASGTLYIEQSPDAINADSIRSYTVEANENEAHRVICNRRFFRIRYENNAAAQSFLRLQTQLGNYDLLTSQLNKPARQDADSLLTKAFTEEALIAQGFVEGFSIVNKFGRNVDIDTGSVPEDVWNGGGPYTGFPTGAPEEVEVFSSSASDTGVLTITYLPSSTATEYLSANITLTGTTPVNTGIVVYRMHTARYDSGNSTGFNVGGITVRHRTTIANVFCVMPIGRSQTNVAAYTVPAQYTAYIRRIFCRVIGATTGVVDGALWIRGLGMGPRLRRPFSSAQQDSFVEQPYGGLRVGAMSDITIRISASSSNNLDVIAGFDLILVKDS